MNPELKAKWIEALRSGKYKQGVGYLHSSEGYCCLGVLADQVDPSKWTEVSGCGFSWFNNYCTFLPVHILSDKIQSKLTHLNDGEKLSFNQIADYIEENL